MGEYPWSDFDQVDVFTTTTHAATRRASPGAEPLATLAWSRPQPCPTSTSNSQVRNSFARSRGTRNSHREPSRGSLTTPRMRGNRGDVPSLTS